MKEIQVKKIKQIQMITINLDLKKKMEALHLAAFTNSIGCLKALLEAGATTKIIDNEGNTALHKAALGGHSEASNISLF